MSYKRFLRAKDRAVKPVGFSVDDSAISESLYPFQRDIVRWAIRLGRAAIFADCGMGKTIQQLEWARLVCAKSGGAVLILAPLAVAKQSTIGKNGVDEPTKPQPVVRGEERFW